MRDLFLPNRCPGCGRFIRWDRLMCGDCQERLDDVSGKVCSVCGKLPCQGHEALIPERVAVVYRYEGKCREAMLAFKYRRGVNFGELGAQRLAELLLQSGDAQKADIVTCVPMSGAKRRRRGYNQAEIIGRYLAKRLGKPFDGRLLTHAPTLTEHHRLGIEERRENAEKSFYPSKKHSDIGGRSVILCDDIYTTGATINACAGRLKEMGAKRVVACCVATTFSRKEKSGSAVQKA